MVAILIRGKICGWLCVLRMGRQEGLGVFTLTYDRINPSKVTGSARCIPNLVRRSRALGGMCLKWYRKLWGPRSPGGALHAGSMYGVGANRVSQSHCGASWLNLQIREG